MRLKDIHTNLNPKIDLQKIYPKKEISVDPFGVDENFFIDIYLNLKKNIYLKKSKKIKINALNKKKNIDVLKNRTKKNKDIVLSKKVEQKGKKHILSSKANLSYFKKRKVKHSDNAKKIKVLVNSILKKSIILWILFIILFIFIDKIAVEYFVKSGYKKIVQLKNTQIEKDREELINSSNLNFKISNILFFPFKILPGNTINNINNSILGGIGLTELLKDGNKFINGLEKLIKEKGFKNIKYSQFLENNKEFFIKFEKRLDNIIINYNNIKLNDLLLQEKVDFLKLKLDELKFYTSTFNNNFETILDILGHNKRRRYAIIFQNNDEIRSHGGFMGSIGIVEIFRGQIKKIEKKDIYNYEFKIKKEKFTKQIAPEGINKLTKYLGLRDSNYFINHKDAAEKIKFFLKKADYKIDGIIYTNQNSLFSILNLVGEYDSKVLNTKINNSNFSLIMSLLVEAKVSQKTTMGTPKKILFDFMDELENQIKNKNISKIEIIKSLYNDIQNRELVFYDFNKSERNLLKQLSLFNPIDYNSSLDFSYPVFNSISGNKSDRYIKFSFIKKITSGKKCSYNTELKINLKHTYSKIDEFKIKKIMNKFGIKTNQAKLLEIQGKGVNKQYVRVIIPKNAKILNKNELGNKIGINFYKERGKVVSFYLNTDVGKKSEFIIKYNLPNNQCKTYNYIHYKQPGIRKYDLEIIKLGGNKSFKDIKKDIYYY